MSTRHVGHWNRRDFLKTAALAGTGSLWGLRSDTLAAEAPPDTTALRLGQSPAICIAPLYLAAEFLPAEGFSKVDYIKTGQHLMAKAVASGALDGITCGFALRNVVSRRRFS